MCELCSSVLLPLQPFLAGTQARAVQPPVHDATDSVALRSWLNTPWTSSLEADLYKVANIINTFTRVGDCLSRRGAGPGGRGVCGGWGAARLNQAFSHDLAELILPRTEQDW